MIFNIQILCVANTFLELIMVLIPSLMKAIGCFHSLSFPGINVEREWNIKITPMGDVRHWCHQLCSRGEAGLAGRLKDGLPPPPGLFYCLGPLTFGLARAGHNIPLEHRNLLFLILRIKVRDVTRCSLLCFLGQRYAKRVYKNKIQP